MSERKQKLRIVLFREGTSFDNALRESVETTEVETDASLAFNNRLLIIEPSISPPEWLAFVEAAAGRDLRTLRNQLSGAVWLI